MPRNPKCRRILHGACLPGIFPPRKPAPVPISMEEVESLRLCDMEGFSQDEAAAQMNISRGTLQRILYSARQKTASALVRGHGLSIGGGHYEVTPGNAAGNAAVPAGNIKRNITIPCGTVRKEVQR